MSRLSYFFNVLRTIDLNTPLWLYIKSYQTLAR
jgi:hypothetical protein